MRLHYGTETWKLDETTDVDDVLADVPNGGWLTIRTASGDTVYLFVSQGVPVWLEDGDERTQMGLVSSADAFQIR